MSCGFLLWLVFTSIELMLWIRAAFSGMVCPGWRGANNALKMLHHQWNHILNIVDLGNDQVTGLNYFKGPFEGRGGVINHFRHIHVKAIFYGPGPDKLRGLAKFAPSGIGIGDNDVVINLSQ